MPRLAVDHVFALIMDKQPGDDRDQRRLAGAVIAQDAGHLALANAQVHAAKRADVSVVFADVVELDDRCVGASHLTSPYWRGRGSTYSRLWRARASRQRRIGTSRGPSRRR